jgi:hypothetical protein
MTLPATALRHTLLAAFLCLPAIALAADPEFTLTLKDHRFQPVELKVPAGKKVKLVIDNQDPTPEEFESKELGREKVVQGRSKATIFVGPLKPGRYPFFGEYNEKTARGVLIAE